MTAALEARVARLEAILAAMVAAAAGGPQASPRGQGAPPRGATNGGPATAPPGGAVDPKLKPGQVADARDMSSQYGDPPVFKDPYGWRGKSHANIRMSQCPSDYLHALADDIDGYGVKLLAQGDTDKATWKFRDAGRARAWALANAEQEPLPGMPAPPRPQQRAPAHDPSTGEYDGSAQDYGVSDDEIPF